MKPPIPKNFEQPVDLSWVEDFPARKFGVSSIDGKPFRQIVIDSALLFMDADQIAGMLGVERTDFDNRCMATFGMSATPVINNLISLADQDARDLMRRLAERGQGTATQIYANYIARLAKEQDASGGVNVTVNISKEDDD